MERKDKDIALKEALMKRKTGELPSNFTYRMMNNIRMEAEKQRKRRKFIFRLAFTIAILSVIGLLYYFIAIYMEFNLMSYMPHPDIQIFKPAPQIMNFYWYIGILVLILLGGDFWMRRKRRKSTRS